MTVLDKLDFSLDSGGFFYAPGNWRAKHAELRMKLEQLFDEPFLDNGNSMASCF